MNLYNFSITFFICTLPTIGFSQRQSDLDVALKFEKDTLAFLDPWHFRVEFSNKSKMDLQVHLCGPSLVPEAVNCEIKIEKKDSKSNQWVDLELINCIWPIDVDDNAIIKPHQPILIQYEIAPPIHIDGLVGNITLRASFTSERFQPDSLKYCSAPVDITILDPLEEDIAALTYLKSAFKIPETIFFPVFKVRGDPANIPMVEYLYEHFPESSFADFATVNLAGLYQLNIRKANANHDIDINTKLGYLRIAKQYGIKGLSSSNPNLAKAAKTILLSNYSILMGMFDSAYPPEELLNEFEFDGRN